VEHIREVIYTTPYVDSVLTNNCNSENTETVSGVFSVRILKEDAGNDECYVEVIDGPRDGKRFLIQKCQLKINK